jgi:hypothetical protein
MLRAKDTLRRRKIGNIITEGCAVCFTQGILMAMAAL